MTVTPEERLADTERARRSGRRVMQGDLRPGVMVGLGSSQVTFWMAAATALWVIIFKGGCDPVAGFVAGVALVGVWWLGWPFIAILNHRGLLTAKGFIRYDSIVALGWAWTGDPLLPFWESWAPVLIVRNKGELVWRPLYELRRGALSREKERDRLLKRLAGPM